MTWELISPVSLKCQALLSLIFTTYFANGSLLFLESRLLNFIGRLIGRLQQQKRNIVRNLLFFNRTNFRIFEVCLSTCQSQSQPTLGCFFNVAFPLTSQATNHKKSNNVHNIHQISCQSLRCQLCCIRRNFQNQEIF